jgi:hypothetical protein
MAGKFVRGFPAALPPRSGSPGAAGPGAPPPGPSLPPRWQVRRFPHEDYTLLNVDFVLLVDQLDSLGLFPPLPPTADPPSPGARGGGGAARDAGRQVGAEDEGG